MRDRSRRAAAVALLGALTLAGCVTFPPLPGPAPEPEVETPVTEDPSGDAAELAGTTWNVVSGEFEAADDASCGSELLMTFRADGWADYGSRCPGETDYVYYEGDNANATWTLDGATLVVDFNDGFNVCEFESDGVGYAGICENVKGEIIPREITRVS